MAKQINPNDYISIVDPQEPEYRRQVSVYRYRASIEFDRDKIQEGIRRTPLRRETFGVIQELPQVNLYTRTLWGKLGIRNQIVVDEQGNLNYLQVRRALVASAVVEFFNDEGKVGIIIFGGNTGIRNEILDVLQSEFGLPGIIQQRISSEQIRRIFSNYSKNLKQIRFDPSEDDDWGNTGDATLSGSRRETINIKARNLRNIESDDNIHIQSFVSTEENQYVSGMLEPIPVRFELKQTAVTINVFRFAVEASARHLADQVFYDLARNVYFKVVGEDQWIDYPTPQHNKPEMRQLVLFTEEEDDELDAANR